MTVQFSHYFSGHAFCIKNSVVGGKNSVAIGNQLAQWKEHVCLDRCEFNPHVGCRHYLKIKYFKSNNIVRKKDSLAVVAGEVEKLKENDLMSSSV